MPKCEEGVKPVGEEGDLPGRQKTPGGSTSSRVVDEPRPPQCPEIRAFSFYWSTNTLRTPGFQDVQSLLVLVITGTSCSLLRSLWSRAGPVGLCSGVGRM